MTDKVKDKAQVSFQDLGVSQPILEVLNKIGYHTPSPIQESFIPLALKGGDATGQARTGTGKTAAFGIPILEHIDADDSTTQALVLAPTRELSEQVAEEIRRLSSNNMLRTVCLVGGRPLGPQISALKKGAQIVIGTPGRVIDLLSRKVLDLRKIKIAILDEADRMLDIGFRPDIEKILKQCPKKRQTLLLSATMSQDVERLAKRFMHNPERVDLSEEGVAVDTIDQYYLTVDPDRKFQTLKRLLVQERPRQVLVFTRTKRGADKLYRRFKNRLPKVGYMHGDLHQSKRDKVLRSFRSGEIRMLIATDVVGRGIDISGISHIINYDMPEDCDDYVHRIGRTGRMTSDENGSAFLFVMPDEGDRLTNIEKRINSMLNKYEIKGYQPFRPRASRPRISSSRSRNHADVA